MTEPKSPQEIVIDECLNKLAEHYDCVQIFASRHDVDDNEKKTLGSDRGKGNWFARYGQVKEWVIREEEATRINTRKDNEG